MQFSLPTQKNSAFTLIELLVVIVIVGILASISISTFNNYMARVRDQKRVLILSEMKKFVELHKTSTGQLPPVVTQGNLCRGWTQISKDTVGSSIDFDLTQFDFDETYLEDCEAFRFYLYNAGAETCDANNGRFLVMGTNLEQMREGGKTRADLGLERFEFSCLRDWTGTSAGYIGSQDMWNTGVNDYKDEFYFGVAFGVYEN